MNQQTVFLTGATGFIGLRLAERLKASGLRLRCLVRKLPAAKALRTLGAEIVEGDVTDRAALRSGMRGCALAYHLAAVYELGVVDEAAMERTNVEGTRAFLDALSATGVPRAVYVSTTVALGPSNSQDISESDRTSEYEGPYPAVYHRTKAAAHGLARTAQERGLPLIIVCPAYVYGPGDKGPAGRFIADLLHRRMPGLLTDPSWFSFVHVDDVAHGLLLAGQRGEPGATYVLSGEAESVNGFARRVAELAHVRLPLLRFPPALAALTGRALDGVARVTGMRFPITRETVTATAHERWLHSSERARHEFGWEARSLEAGLPETVTWFQNQPG